MMTDAIIYVPDFAALVGWAAEHHPDCLARDEQGEILDHPVITGLARTPAVVNGNQVLVYARLTSAQAEQWRGMPGVQVLAEAPFEGRGTAAQIYDQVFADPELLALFDSVYDRSPREVDDGEGGTMTITPPKWFGIMAGA